MRLPVLPLSAEKKKNQDHWSLRTLFKSAKQGSGKPTVSARLSLCSRSAASGSPWPMGRSTPGFPVLRHLPEFAQTHVRWVSDDVPPSPYDSQLPRIIQLLLKWSQKHKYTDFPRLLFQWLNWTCYYVFRTPSHLLLHSAVLKTLSY